MKKGWIIVFLLSFCCCTVPRYIHVYETPQGVDFTRGNWLVLDVFSDLPLQEREYLTDILVTKIGNFRKDSVSALNQICLRYLTPERFSFELSLDVLDVLKKTTPYDYVVTAKTKTLRNDITPLVGYQPIIYEKNEVEVWIAIYDVHTGQRIYCQRVIGAVTLDKGDDRVWFGHTVNVLMHKTLTRALRDLKRHSFLP